MLDLHERAAEIGVAVQPLAVIASLTHLVDMECVFIALSSGELLLLHLGAPGQIPAELEEVGALPDGVVAAEWSPDGTSLAVVGGAGQLLLMSYTWDVLAEHMLPAALSAEAEFVGHSNSSANAVPDHASSKAGRLLPGNVSISWRGDSKYLATCHMGAGSSSGSMVTVWERETGALHAMGEDAELMLGPLAWQPNGRHLYAAQRAQHGSVLPATQPPPPPRQHREQQQSSVDVGVRRIPKQVVDEEGYSAGVQHVGAWKRELRRKQAAEEEAAAAARVLAGAGSAGRVVLFERNGLQHGSFDVPAFLPLDGGGGGQGCVVDLQWSPDSEFLAVVVAAPTASTLPNPNSNPNPLCGEAAECQGGEGAEGVPPRCQLQLWQRRNWHWYLKLERRYCTASVVVRWEESSAGGALVGPWGAAELALHVGTAEGELHSMHFVSDACVSALGTAAVVDGASVLLTAMRLAIVPPPMCTATLACWAPVSCVALRDGCGSEVRGEGGGGAVPRYVHLARAVLVV